MVKAILYSKKVRLESIIKHWYFGTILLFLLMKMLFLFYKILNIKRDGWRKTTSVYHRNEESKYIGGIFNISVDSGHDQKDIQTLVLNKFYDAFHNSAESHYALKWTRLTVNRIYIKHTDFSVVKLIPGGEIDDLEFIPDKRFMLDPAISDTQVIKVKGILKDCYNSTLKLPDYRRPVEFRRIALKKIMKQTSGADFTSLRVLFDRIIRSPWIYFNYSWPSSEREFRPAFFDHFKHAGHGLINIECRSSGSKIELWFQISHVGLDGRNALKLLDKIRKEFDLDKKKFVIPESKLLYPPTYNSFKNGKVHQGCAFVDMSPLFKAHVDLQEKYGQIHPISLLAWALSQHPVFHDKKFNISIDIPATNPVDRSVGFVFIRPNSFLKNNSTSQAFTRYIRQFNTQALQVRKRTGDNFLVVETSVLVPVRIMRIMLMIMPGALQEIIGTTNITLLEGIECALPSLSDNINDAVIFTLPSARKPYLGCIGARAFLKPVKPIMEAVTGVIANFDSYITNIKR